MAAIDNSKIKSSVQSKKSLQRNKTNRPKRDNKIRTSNFSDPNFNSTNYSKKQLKKGKEENFDNYTKEPQKTSKVLTSHHDNKKQLLKSKIYQLTDLKNDDNAKNLLNPKNSTEVVKEKKISNSLWENFSSNDILLLKNINSAIQRKEFEEAIKIAENLSNAKIDHSVKKVSLNAAITDIVRWNKFSNNINPKKISFNEISSFAIDNPYLPNIDAIRKNVEKVIMTNSISSEESERYFATFPPLSSESKIYLIESKINSFVSTDKSSNDLSSKNLGKIKNELRADIVKLWTKENFSLDEEQKFLQKYEQILTEDDHINRIERLIWNNRNQDAIRIFPLINQDYQKLYNSIIKISSLPSYIDNLILSVPRKLRSNELLVNRVIIWHKSNDNFDQIIDLLSNLPQKTIYPDEWWSYRKIYGRELLKKKDFKTAYKIFSFHNLPTSSSNFWEAEWTSGWIALRFLKDPESALKHFSSLQKNVSLPVSASRAAYWLGMTYEAMKDNSKAIDWYKKAAQYPTLFYGQLAIHKHRLIDPFATNDINLPKDPDITGRDLYNISNSRAAQIAYILALTGDTENSGKIFNWLVLNSPTNGQVAVLMKIVNELGDRQLDAKISRTAALKNIFFIKNKFQIIKEVSSDKFAPLIHAIIKQESNFAPSALSKVGAIGFMQLMPDTAKLVAKEMRIKYDKKRLATDVSYNVLLGSYYIKKLLAQFGDSEILAIASYNAGPNATQRWVNEFYDPRTEKDHDRVVDWIELITYSETRNYVQRIIENMIVYKYLLSRSNFNNFN